MDVARYLSRRASQTRTQQMTSCNDRSNDPKETGHDVVGKAMLEHELVLLIRTEHRNVSIFPKRNTDDSCLEDHHPKE